MATVRIVALLAVCMAWSLVGGFVQPPRTIPGTVRAYPAPTGQQVCHGCRRQRTLQAQLTTAAPPGVKPRQQKVVQVPLTPAAPSGIKPPAQLYQNAVSLGEMKAKLSVSKTAILGLASGCHIAFGGLLALIVGGNCPGLLSANPGLQKIIMGVFGLPFGLYMTVTAGGELFTGNTALLPAALLEGKATWQQLLKNWAVSYVGNFAGSLLMVWLFSAAGILPPSATAIGVATSKTTQPFQQAFLRGVLANWLVCMAVWMATGASDACGKYVSIVLPISAFVAMGFDHSIANMFYIPIGMVMGASVTIRQFLIGNLLPVTLGNIVGGALAVAGVYGSAYGSKKEQ